MMKIVFIITNLNTGGAEIMLYNLLRHLDRKKFEPIIISLVGIGDIGPSIEALGVSIYKLSLKRGAIPTPLAFFKLINLLRKLKPDVVHTWMYHADMLGGVGARLAGIRNVAWGLHNSELPRETTKLSTRAVMKMCSKLSFFIPKHIVSCSARAREVHIENGYCESKILVIPNGFEPDVFVPNSNARQSLRSELGLKENSLLVGMMARYDPQKNHLGFLEAAATVVRELPDINFVLAGSGIDYENEGLQTAIRAHGLSEQLHLLGRRDDMPRLMAGLDVLAAPSHSEAFSIVLCEAMGCGVPCVATQSADPANIIGAAGHVVPTGDIASFARCLIEVLRLSESERLRIGHFARERVVQKYDISHMVMSYQNLYEKMYFGLSL